MDAHTAGCNQASYTPTDCECGFTRQFLAEPGYSERLPRRLHLRDAGCREPFAQDRFDRAGLEQAFGNGLYGEGVRNRDLDGSHEAIPQTSGLYAENSPTRRQPPGSQPFRP